MIMLLEEINGVEGQEIGGLQKGGRQWERYEGDDWEKVTATADSGACRTVIPREVGEEYGTEETPQSKAGMKFQAANGTEIGYYGNRKLPGVGETGISMTLEGAVADVTKVLVAVGAVCDAGNRVVFEAEGGEIINKATGKKIPMRRQGGTYEFDMWVKGKGDKSGGREWEGKIKGGPRSIMTMFRLKGGKTVTTARTGATCFVKPPDKYEKEVEKRVTMDAETLEVIDTMDF